MLIMQLQFVSQRARRFWQGHQNTTGETNGYRERCLPGCLQLVDARRGLLNAHRVLVELGHEIRLLRLGLGPSRATHVNGKFCRYTLEVFRSVLQQNYTLDCSQMGPEIILLPPSVALLSPGLRRLCRGRLRVAEGLRVRLLRGLLRQAVDHRLDETWKRTESARFGPLEST